MLQGQTYTVMLPFTSTLHQNFVACSEIREIMLLLQWSDLQSTLRANIAMGRDRSRVPRKTRKASALFLVIPQRVFAVTL